MQEDSFTGRIANLVIFRVTEFGFWGQGGTAERLPPKAAVRNCSRPPKGEQRTRHLMS